MGEAPTQVAKGEGFMTICLYLSTKGMTCKPLRAAFSASRQKFKVQRTP